MVRKYRLPIEIPLHYYAPIGEAIYRWALLEYQMQTIIWLAMGVDNKQGRTLTIGMDCRVLSAIMRTVSLKWAINKLEVRLIRSLAKDAMELYSDRNLLAHGVWKFPKDGDPKDIYFHHMQESQRRIMPRAEKKLPRHIKTTATKFKRLNERAERLIDRIQKRREKEKQQPST